MIQRIQTIFLFLASAACVAFLFFPNWWVQNNNESEGSSITLTASPMKVWVESSAMSLENTFTTTTMSFTENIYLTLQFALACASALLLLITIFLYGNRKLQIKLGYVAILLLMLINVLMVPVRNWLQGLAGEPSTVAGMYLSGPKWAIGLTLVALLLTWFAIKRIQKDEKMVQGMDRLR